jgi:hypothetical protein
MRTEQASLLAGPYSVNIQALAIWVALGDRWLRFGCVPAVGVLSCVACGDDLTATDVPPAEDLRDALIREQAERLAVQDRQLAQLAV